MPYLTTVNRLAGLSTADKMELIREFDAMRRELDEMRANFNNVLTKLDADAGVTAADFVSTSGVSTSGGVVTTVTASAARRFTQL
jgi:hypothetical protein